MKKQIISLFVIISFLIGGSAFAQEQTQTEGDPIKKVLKSGFKVKLNETGKSYLKLGMGINFWARYAELNPGSIDNQTGLPSSDHFDFAMRRMRISMLANFEGKFYLYTQYGNTSTPFYNEARPEMFFHDFWGKFKIAKGLYIGGGQHMWNGLSRLSNVSYGSVMAIDNPGFNFPNVNVTDQFIRQMGMFVQGKFGRLEYQLSVNKPLMPKNSTKVFSDDQITDKANLDYVYNRKHDNLNSKGYASWSFFYNEPVATTPFKTLTYFGEKGKILNIGAGYQLEREAGGAMTSTNPEVITTYDHFSWSADVLFELPLPQKSALTVYSAYYNYDYGPNYLWKTIPMGGFASLDPNYQGTDILEQQGGGINQFTFGTGEVVYLNVGYVLPKSIINSDKRLQPFFAMSYKDLEGLEEASLQSDYGVNYLIYGHKVKLTAQYSTRPVYNAERKVGDQRGLFITQMQIKF